MAKTNMFAQGNLVDWNGEVGKIVRNDKDYRYWVVEFPSHTKVLHYEDLEITFERSHQ